MFKIMRINEPMVYNLGLAGVRRLPDGRVQGMSSDETFAHFQPFYNFLKNDISRYSSTRIPAASATHLDLYLGKTLVMEDSPSYPPFIDHLNIRSGSNNSPFLQKKKDGLIVTSDYIVYKSSVISYPSELIESDSLGSDYAQRVASEYPGSFHADGYFWLNQEFGLASGSMTLVRARYSTVKGSYQPPQSFDLSSLRESVMPFLTSFDSRMVTKTIGEANSRYVDALTALAEFPKTVQSVISGFKLISKLVIDLKQRNLTLSKAFDSRKRFLESRLASDLHRYRSRRPNSGAATRLLERQVQRAHDSYSRALKRSLVEFNDAVASTWLNFRYNIMPNVYLIEDVIKAANALDSVYQTSRDFSSSEETLSWEGHELALDSTLRCFVKYGFKPTETSFEKWSKTMSANILVTAWELVPLSFVIDWFINVGDALSTLSIPVDVEQKVFQFSNKVELTHSGTSLTGGEFRISVSAYNRRNINPYEISCITFGANLNTFRVLDATALLWSPIRKVLISSKRLN